MSTQIPCHLNQTSEYDESSVVGRYKRPNIDTADIWAFPVLIDAMETPQVELYDDLVEIYRAEKPAPGADFTTNLTPVAFGNQIDIKDEDIIRCVSVGKVYTGEYWKIQGNPKIKSFLANKQNVKAVRIEQDDLPDVGQLP
jgi:hypothetical protein